MNVPGGYYQEKILHLAAGATGNGETLDVVDLTAGAKTMVGIQIKGITTATITFEATINGVDWVAILAENVTTGAESTTATADGIFRITALGVEKVRARISAWTSGAITVIGLVVA